MPAWTMAKQGTGGRILVLSDSEQDPEADSDAFMFQLLTSWATIVFSSTSALWGFNLNATSYSFAKTISNTTIKYANHKHLVKMLVVC
jgi:hypothetical protein